LGRRFHCAVAAMSAALFAEESNVPDSLAMIFIVTK
jgi:hypothetical protein